MNIEIGQQANTGRSASSIAILAVANSATSLMKQSGVVGVQNLVETIATSLQPGHSLNWSDSGCAVLTLDTNEQNVGAVTIEPGKSYIDFYDSKIVHVGFTTDLIMAGLRRVKELKGTNPNQLIRAAAGIATSLNDIALRRTNRLGTFANVAGAKIRRLHGTEKANLKLSNKGNEGGIEVQTTGKVKFGDMTGELIASTSGNLAIMNVGKKSFAVSGHPGEDMMTLRPVKYAGQRDGILRVAYVDNGTILKIRKTPKISRALATVRQLTPAPIYIVNSSVTTGDFGGNTDQFIDANGFDSGSQQGLGDNVTGGQSFGATGTDGFVGHA